jgi:GTPase
MIRRGGGATGYVDSVYLAHLLPHIEENVNSELPWTVSPPLNLESLSKQDFLELVEGLEAEFQREFTARQVDSDHDRVLLVGLMTDDMDDRTFEDGLSELERLVDTAGGDVLQVTRQKRGHPHPQTVIGSGKVEEIALQVQTSGANLVVFNRDLSPAQIRNLENQIGVRVVDRTEVILDIFAQRARTQAGKLQVELAQLEYTLPRLTGRGQAMSRLDEIRDGTANDSEKTLATTAGSGSTASPSIEIAETTAETGSTQCGDRRLHQCGQIYPD